VADDKWTGKAESRQSEMETSFPATLLQMGKKEERGSSGKNYLQTDRTLPVSISTKKPKSQEVQRGFFPDKASEPWPTAWTGQCRVDMKENV